MADLDQQLKDLSKQIIHLRRAKTDPKNKLAKEVFNLYQAYEEATYSIHNICENNNDHFVDLVKERTSNVLLIGKENAPKLVQIKNTGDHDLKELKATKLESSLTTFKNLNIDGFDETLHDILNFHRNTTEFIKNTENVMKVLKNIQRKPESEQDCRPDSDISVTSTDVSQMSSFLSCRALVTSSPINH